MWERDIISLYNIILHLLCFPSIDVTFGKLMSAQFVTSAYHKTAGVKIFTHEVWKNVLFDYIHYVLYMFIWIYVYIFVQFCTLCIFIFIFIYFYSHVCMSCSVYSVSLCCSAYCLCVNVNCISATACQLNCS